MLSIILNAILVVLSLVLGFLLGFQVCNKSWAGRVDKLTRDILEIADEAMRKKEKKS